MALSLWCGRWSTCKKNEIGYRVLERDLIITPRIERFQFSHRKLHDCLCQMWGYRDTFSKCFKDFYFKHHQETSMLPSRADVSRQDFDGVITPPKI